MRPVRSSVHVDLACKTVGALSEAEAHAGLPMLSPSTARHQPQGRLHAWSHKLRHVVGRTPYKHTCLSL